MKIEIIDSNGAVISIYSISGFSLPSIEEWRTDTQVEMSLDKFSDTVSHFMDTDHPSDEIIDVDVKPAIFLPYPIVQDVCRFITEPEIEGRTGSNQPVNVPSDFKEFHLTPLLDPYIVLRAIAEEVVSNHKPNNSYKVKIYDA